VKDFQLVGEFSTNTGTVPTLSYCGNQLSSYTLYHANGCGWSSEYAETNLLIQYEHITVNHSNDTIDR